MYKISVPDKLRTFKGEIIDLTNIDPAQIEIEDIAHALSNLCRFGGHSMKFYSVAQHSVMCAGLVKSGLKLAALLHDASEAYLLDLPRPLKALVSEYQGMEERTMRAIARRFSFKYPLDPLVDAADQTMLMIEWRKLMIPGHGEKFDCWAPEVAEEHFLRLFYKYAPAK